MKYPVIWTDNMADWQDGVTWGPIVRIRPKCREDEGVYQHELIHVKQWFLTLTLHWFLYAFRWYRLWSEVQAYKVQTQYGMSLELAADHLAQYYDLNITKDRALQELTA